MIQHQRFDLIARIRDSLALTLTLSLASGAAGAQFVRGDSNGDGVIDISDPVLVLNRLFSGGPALACADAADVDDSGRLDVADPIGVLEFLFRGGRPPALPHPLPGFDPSPDALDCRGEPDPDERLAVEDMAEDAADRADWAASGSAASPEELSGSPMIVDTATFAALEALASGQPLAAAPGLDAAAFQAAFFGSWPPSAGGPTVLTVDATAPLPPGGCFWVPPTLVDGGSYASSPSGGFIRGDVDSNGVVDASDAASLAACLEGRGGCPDRCWDAADADDNGEIEAADVQAILMAQIQEFKLPPPVGSCGVDPTPDPLPGCSGQPCPPSGRGLRLAVEPPVVCGPGPHLVTLVASDARGRESRGASLVLLCPKGEEGCPDTPSSGAPPASGGDLGGPIVCRWVVARTLDPEELETELHQNVYDVEGQLVGTRREAPLLAGGAMEVWRTDLGPGPQHYLSAARLNANCSTPDTDLSFPREGSIQIRVNLLCVRADGTVVSCPAQADVEGMYRARVEVGTSAGPGCASGPNRVEALAQDEASLLANSTKLFEKGVAVQSGNTITASPSFSGDLGVGVNGQGVSADAAVHFGYSQSSTDNTGRSEDILDAFGSAAKDLPLTIHLQAKGRIEVQAHRRTWARAKSRMLVAGIWLVARTQCPVDSPLCLSDIMGEDAERPKAEKRASQFRQVRLGR